MTEASDRDRTMSGRTAGDRAAESTSPLVSYALKGLRRLWLPAQDRYSHSHPLDMRSGQSLPLPAGNTFYTLNVLLGLSRVRK